MKKILSILLAVSLMTMSLGTMNVQIKDTAVRKDMAEAGATPESQKPNTDSRAIVSVKPEIATYTDNTGLKFTSDADGAITLSEVANNLTADKNMLVIPATAKNGTDDVAVKKITANTLDKLDQKNPEYIKTLVLPESITEIVANGLSKLTGLEKIIVLKDSKDPVTGLGTGHGAPENANVRYQDQMPTISEEDVNKTIKDKATPGYDKVVQLTGNSTLENKTVEIKNSSNATITEIDLGKSNDTSNPQTVKAIDSDDFETIYKLSISKLGTPVPSENAEQVNLPQADFDALKGNDKKEDLKSKILELSKLKVIDADTKQPITPTIADDQIKKLQDLQDFSQIVELNATSTSETEETSTHAITVKVIPTATTPDQPTQPEKVTLETLKAKITEAEALKSEDYTKQTFESLTKAITEAKAVVAKDATENKPTEEEIKSSYEVLVKAIDALRKPVAEGTVATESGKVVTAEEIPSTSNDYKKIETAVKSVDLSIAGADKFDITNAKVTQVLDLKVTDVDAKGETVKLKLAKVTDGKKYVLAHYNQDTGKIDAIYEGVDNGDGTYSFSGIKAFSPFAVMEVTPKAATDSSNNSTSKNPSTGDSTGIAIFLTLTIASATGAYVVRKKLVK